MFSTDVIVSTNLYSRTELIQLLLLVLSAVVLFIIINNNAIPTDGFIHSKINKRSTVTRNVATRRGKEVSVGSSKVDNYNYYAKEEIRARGEGERSGRSVEDVRDMVTRHRTSRLPVRLPGHRSACIFFDSVSVFTSRFSRGVVIA